MIDEFNEWPFFETNEALKSENEISDERFRIRLRTYFTKLDKLIKLPENKIIEGFRPESNKNLVSANYFPKWMYCTSCHAFNHYDNWKRHWENTVKEAHKENFHPPKCYKCYVDKDKKGLYYDLEQVRFVMTSPSGNIADVPWKHWVLRKQATLSVDTDNDGGEEEGNQILLDLNAVTIPENLELQYRTSAKFGDLKGIRIIAYNQNQQIATTTLAGIFNLRVWESQHPDVQSGKSQLKTVLRSSNSVYYPNIAGSIYLPVANQISQKIIDDIQEEFKDNIPIERINEKINRRYKISLPIELFQFFIDNNFQSSIIPALNEVQYRLEEYQFITEKESYREPELIFQRVSPENFNIQQISNIFRIDRLKVTSVQTSYTRQKPIDKDAALNLDIEGETQRKYTSSYGKNTFYLPAYESFGEGILIQLNKEKLASWEEQKEVKERSEFLQVNFNNSFLGQGRQKDISPRFILIHTLSHLIIKELEFLCGYPAASLQERLYVSDKMEGVLIYTVAGSEGSYGGLVNLCKSVKIGELLHSALHRANDCSSDPICYNTDQQGQGTAGLNLAACYSCALLPETSCEEFNSFLDRALLIDTNYGFFSFLQ